MGAVMSCCAVNLAECAACAACSCFATALNWTMSQAARFSHLLLVLLTFTVAIVLGRSYPNQVNGYNDYTQVDLTGDCQASYLNECIYRQLIYRASFALVVVFVVLAIFSACSDTVNKGFWLMKLGAAIGLFVAFWWADNSFFSGWAETARVISFLWLIVQSLLYLDFSFDLHAVVMGRAEEAETKGEDARLWYGFYLFGSLGALTCVGVGLAYLFRDFTDCSLGMFFTLLTLFVGVITGILSLLNSVNKGLITPCWMFAYSVFMCWYALLSSPDSQCNPNADENNGSKDVAVIVVAVVSVVILLYCVVNGTKILNIFNPEGQGVLESYNTGGHDASRDLQSILTSDDSKPAGEAPQAMNINRSASADRYYSEQSSGTTHERVFFHILMILVCSYGAMILTSWGSTDGSPENFNRSSERVGNESMWFKIISQWLLLIFFARALQVAYEDNKA